MADIEIPLPTDLAIYFSNVFFIKVSSLDLEENILFVPLSFLFTMKFTFLNI